MSNAASNSIRTKDKTSTIKSITLPAPYWWFFLRTDNEVERRSYLKICGHKESLLSLPIFSVRAAEEFNWTEVRETSEEIIRILGHKKMMKNWPSMSDMKDKAGLIVGIVEKS